MEFKRTAEILSPVGLHMPAIPYWTANTNWRAQSVFLKNVECVLHCGHFSVRCVILRTRDLVSRTELENTYTAV